MLHKLAGVLLTEKLMAALVAGKEGFTYLSNILCILLQTLLQDKLAEVSTTCYITTFKITVRGTGMEEERSLSWVSRNPGQNARIFGDPREILLYYFSHFLT